MGKIVIKTIKNGNAAKIEIRNFEEIDAAKMILCALAKVTSELNQEDKNLILYAAATILQRIADKANSKRGEEQEDGNNSD